MPQDDMDMTAVHLLVSHQGISGIGSDCAGLLRYGPNVRYLISTFALILKFQINNKVLVRRNNKIKTIVSNIWMTDHFEFVTYRVVGVGRSLGFWVLAS
jgi:hypothetical protein